MSTPDRLAAIRAGVDAGMSLRAIARSLGISDKTVRTTLRSADSAPSLGAFPDYIPLGPERVLPTPTPEQRLFAGGVSHPRKAWIRCHCGGPAWRFASGVDEWECEATGPRSPHGPRQVFDQTGTPQLVFAPYRILAFPRESIL